MASTFDDYLAASAQQMAARGQLLLAKIPRKLPREYGGLIATTRDRLNSAITEFGKFGDGSMSVLPASLRQRKFRRLVADLDLIERFALKALNRTQDDDHRLTALIARACDEIAYPLPAPVVTALSTGYFEIVPFFQLMMVPLTEGSFLLHLPDLYHELAHPLLTDAHDPLIEPFRKRFSAVVSNVAAHFAAEIAAVRRGRTPVDLVILLSTAEYSWIRSWATEFFCDLFAVCTVGPAFAWAHLHLHSKRGRMAYEVPHYGPSTHPADAARMIVLISALEKLGFTSEARAIEAKWTELLKRMEPGPSPEFHRCYPPTLLEQCVNEVMEGSREMGCNLAGPSMNGKIRGKLNEAWQQMWHSSQTYLDWEKQQVAALHASLVATP
jgi:hypothetical protein